MRVSDAMLKELRRIERGLETQNAYRVVTDDNGSRWWRELGACDRRTLPALEERKLVDTREDPGKYHGTWQVRLTEYGRHVLEEHA